MRPRMVRVPLPGGPPLRAMLRQYRLTHGIGQGDLADMLGISRPSLCRFELGHTLEARNVVKLIHWLFTEPACAIPSEFAAPAEPAKSLCDLRDLENPDVRQTA